MNTLLVFASKHGSTQKAANILFDKLSEPKKIVNIMEDQSPDITDFDTVIIGGSIYGGNIQKAIKAFAEQNLKALLNKKIGLFLCCGMESDFEKQLNNSFPEELIKSSTAKGYFGYEYNKDDMNLLEKMVVKVVTKNIDKDSNIKDVNIENFSKLIQGE